MSWFHTHDEKLSMIKQTAGGGGSGDGTDWLVSTTDITLTVTSAAVP
jgi:hypothetical protein